MIEPAPWTSRGKRSAADSKNYRDHLWLGQILWAAAEIANAERELRHAVELGGQAPDALVTLVQYLARTGRKDQAQKTIEEARGRLAGDRSSLALAQCYIEVGNLDQARAQFRSALATDPADVVVLRADAVFALNTGSIDQAEHDLRKIIDLQVKAPDDAAWARRLLATLLASSGDRRKVLERSNWWDSRTKRRPTCLRATSQSTRFGRGRRC